MAEEIAAHGGVVAVLKGTGVLGVEGGDRGCSVDQRGSLPGGRGSFDRVVLVEDRPDDFLQQVLHRDQPRGSAVFVEHDGHVGLEPLHVGEHVLDLPGAGHEVGRPHD